jgi:hypothetical protein
MKFESFGEKYSGKTYEDVVKAMAAQKLSKPESLTKYMKQTAKRVKAMSGDSVPTTTPEKFVKGLVKAGFMEAVG